MAMLPFRLKHPPAPGPAASICRAAVGLGPGARGGGANPLFPPAGGPSSVPEPVPDSFPSLEAATALACRAGAAAVRRSPDCPAL